MTKQPDDLVHVAVMGGSGYTGAELVRLLAVHPNVKIAALLAGRRQETHLRDIFPHLSVCDLPALQSEEDIDWSEIDVLFCALPHGVTQEVIQSVLQRSDCADLKIIDLSADFRLRDQKMYQDWYHKPHTALELQKKFIYGLPEFYRTQISGANYVANTGCYVAASLLPLIPLLRAKAIDPATIVIDAKSGISGAGRAVQQGALYCETNESLHAYKADGHRHLAEMIQELSLFAEQKVEPVFVPHLVPQERGILATIYVDPLEDCDGRILYEILKKTHIGHPFVHVLPFGQLPKTKYVRGSNYNMIGVAQPSYSKKVVITSVIDNLVKGAAGQAVQNMNVMFELPEQQGLTQLPLFP